MYVALEPGDKVRTHPSPTSRGVFAPGTTQVGEPSAIPEFHSTMFPLVRTYWARQESVRGIPSRRGGPSGGGGVGGNVEDFGESKVSPQRYAAEAHYFGGNEEIPVLLEL